MLEKTYGYQKYAKILLELHERCRPLLNAALANLQAKALGHVSPFGSYWIALSLINDGEANELVEQYLGRVSKWSVQILILRPRVLHLRAELACRTNPSEVLSCLFFM